MAGCCTLSVGLLLPRAGRRTATSGATSYRVLCCSRCLVCIVLLLLVWRSSAASNGDWSYFHGGGATRLISLTIGQLLEQRTNENPGGEAFVFVRQGVRCTFEQVLQQVGVEFCQNWSFGVRSVLTQKLTVKKSRNTVFITDNRLNL